MCGQRPSDDGGPAQARIWILGRLKVWRIDGSVVDPQEFRTIKTRHLLRLLALHGSDGVSIARVIDDLWPSAAEDRGRASLRTAASQLRHTLGHDHVQRRGETLRLVDAHVDLAVFSAAARRAREAAAAGDLTAALRAATLALETYGGDLAADEPFLEPLVAAQHIWRSEYCELSLLAADAAVASGRLEVAVRLAERLVASDATCERATRVLIRAYLDLDEPAAAVRAYGRLHQALRDELGIAPSAATQQLLRAVVVHPPRAVTA